MPYTSLPIHTDSLGAAEKVRDVSATIAYLAPRFAPLVLLASQFNYGADTQYAGTKEPGVMYPTPNVRTVKSWEYEWYEDERKAMKTQINAVGGYASNITALVVDDAAIFSVNDICKVVRTGETMYITAVTLGTNTITVTRSWGSVAAAALLDNDVIAHIGNAQSQTGSPSDAQYLLPNQKTNFIQIFKQTVKTSYGSDNQAVYTGTPRDAYRRKGLIEHIQEMESALLFGEKNKGTAADGSPIYSTSGLSEFITTNVTAVGGALSKATFNSWLNSLFQFGSPERVLLCSRLAANAISNFAADDASAPKSQFWFLNGETEFSLNVMKYSNKFGTVHILVHNLLDEAGYSGHVIAVDPANLGLAKLENGFFMNLRPDIVQTGAHVYVDEIVSYAGLEYRQEKTAGMLTGITG